MKIAKGVYSVGAALLLFIVGTTYAVPRIAWSERSLEVEVITGTIVVKPVTLVANEELAGVAYKLAGELGDLVRVSAGPSGDPLEANEQHLSLHFIVPDDTPVGEYEGTLHVRLGKRTLAKPLPIRLKVIEPTATSIPQGIAAIMPERIVTDTETGSRYIKGQAEVSLRDETDVSAFSARLQQIGGVFVGRVPGVPLFQVRFTDAVTAADLDGYIEQLRADPDVMGVTREWLMEPRVKHPTDKQYDQTEKAWEEIDPNCKEDDPCKRNEPWVFARFPDAWDLVYSGETADSLRKIPIGIVDTGFWGHPDLRENIKSPSLLRVGHAEIIFSIFSEESLKNATHGTRVAGVLGAGWNNDESIGEDSVAGGIWNRELRFYDATTVTAFGAMAQIRAAVKEGTKVVNLSSGKVYSDQAEFDSKRREWLDNVFNKDAANVVFVLSVDNDLDVDWRRDLPAVLATERANVISVTGSSVKVPSTPLPYFALAGRGGGDVTIAAPHRHYTTEVEEGFELPRWSFTYNWAEGTSYSAPVVSALAGLLLTHNPRLNANQVKDVIVGGACLGERSVLNAPENRGRQDWLPPIPIVDAYQSLILASALPPEYVPGTPGETCAQLVPPTVKIEAVPSTINPGQSTRLRWSSPGIMSCHSAEFPTTPLSSGEVTLVPEETRTYSIVCRGLNGTATDSVTVEVIAPPAPTASLIAIPTSIMNGQSTTLTWSSTNADACTGTGFNTGGAASGNATVSPPATTTYNLTCTGPGGTANSPATVTVAAVPPPGNWSITPASVSAGEGSGSIAFTITRIDSTSAQTVYVSTVQDQGVTNVGDYVGKLNEPLSFATGQTQQPVTVTITDDTAVEGNEAFRLIVQQLPTDPIITYLASSTFTIIDNDAAPPPSATHPLNDTGLDWCANASQNNLACPVSGFPGQDAESGRDVTHNDDSDGHAGFSFTKISNSGNALPNSAALGSGASDWGCTRDNVTGLIWEVKPDDGGLRDKDWTYSWYNPDAATNGGFAGYADYANNCFDTARCDTHKFVADVNAQALCGASDWRLPNRFELESLTSNDRVSPAIDTAFFPNTPSGWFWSSSPYAGTSGSAWYVAFSDGNVDSYAKSYASYVRLVRGGQ